MFRGCYVALVTPFKDGAIDTPALEALVEHVIAGGVAGLVPCGTTGEAPTLSPDEQLKVISTAAAISAKRAHVVAGTGTNSTAKSITASQAAVKAGADGVMLVAPYYNKPNQTGLRLHFGEIARQVDAPIILYNIPGRSGVEIAIDTIVRLHEEHKNIVAVKHATGSVDGACRLAAACDIAIMSGDDPITLPLMSVGATGVISVVANLLPREVTTLVNAALEGDWASAQSCHRRLYTLSQNLLGLDTNPIPIKTALAMMGMMTEEFRLPMCQMDEDKKKRLAVTLKQCEGLGKNA